MTTPQERFKVQDRSTVHGIRFVIEDTELGLEFGCYAILDDAEQMARFYNAWRPCSITQERP